MADPPPPPPAAPLVHLAPNIVLQPPLSRRGHGPGLIIFVPASYAEFQKQNDTLDPEPLQKWAEEGYAVVKISFDKNEGAASKAVTERYNKAIDALLALPDCELAIGATEYERISIVDVREVKKDKVGIIIYGSQADYAPDFDDGLWDMMADQRASIGGIVVYDNWYLGPETLALYQLSKNIPEAEHPKETHHLSQVHIYPGTSSAGFIFPGHPDFKISSAGVAHTRALTFLKKYLGGPYFDLEKIWEEHTFFEFGDRSVERTMATMVQEPYVNHVPTITGGIGRAQLTNFYRDHFIFSNPADTELELISRTVGVDRIIDEFILSLTHDREIDWLLPGIPPTNKPLRIPFTSVVNIRGDRLCHEHISWDQATVLVQLGLMPEYLPFPYALPGGKLPGPGKRFEYRVPAAGAETAAKLRDERAVESNSVLGFGVEGAVREVDDS